MIDLYAEDAMAHAFPPDEISDHDWDKLIDDSKKESDNTYECEFIIGTREISPIIDRDSYEYKKGVEEERERILKVIDEEIEPYKIRKYHLEVGVLEDLKDVILGKKEGGEWAD